MEPHRERSSPGEDEVSGGRPEAGDPAPRVEQAGGDQGGGGPWHLGILFLAAAPFLAFVLLLLLDWLLRRGP